LKIQPTNRYTPGLDAQLRPQLPKTKTFSAQLIATIETIQMVTKRH
jgi:hypothetical protein